MILPFEIKDRAISEGSEITFGNQGNSPFTLRTNSIIALFILGLSCSYRKNIHLNMVNITYAAYSLDVESGFLCPSVYRI